MEFDNLIEQLNQKKDNAQAEKMSAYMQNLFPFLGIPKPLLKEITKPYLSATRKECLDWDLIFKFWDLDFREAQYIALDYLDIHKKQLKPEHLDNLKRIITTKSWWETVDTIDAFVGQLVMQDETLREEVTDWSISDNIWLRRVSIDYQQRFKEKTNIDSLSKAIINNLGSNEFFINKAIGWSLREYSKTNPDWVRQFLDKYQDKMDKLSIREAKKYL